MLREKILSYINLTRLNKPIGILLLLWPTLWALWLAAGEIPQYSIIFIFLIGTVLMRSAGCVINDYADRDFDRHVQRTQNRPLTTGKISARAALILFALLILSAFILILFLNIKTILLAFVGLFLAIIYPFMKRYTHWPQVFLGMAFAWAVPLAFCALTNTVPMQAWLIYFAAVIWPVIYDTMYAMVDREDDLKIGIKSTAILFGRYDKIIIAVLQIIFLLLLLTIGLLNQLKLSFYLSLVLACILSCYQQFLIKDRIPSRCFTAFLNNNWLGMIIFLGIAISIR